MVSIPSTGYNNFSPYDMADGMEELQRNIPRERMSRIIDGMLFHVASVDLPCAGSEEDRRLCQAKTLVLRDLRGCLAYDLTPENER